MELCGGEERETGVQGRAEGERGRGRRPRWGEGGSSQGCVFVLCAEQSPVECRVVRVRWSRGQWRGVSECECATGGAGSSEGECVCVSLGSVAVTLSLCSTRAQRTTMGDEVSRSSLVSLESLVHLVHRTPRSESAGMAWRPLYCSHTGCPSKHHSSCPPSSPRHPASTAACRRPLTLTLWRNSRFLHIAHVLLSTYHSLTQHPRQSSPTYTEHLLSPALTQIGLTSHYLTIRSARMKISVHASAETVLYRAGMRRKTGIFFGLRWTAERKLDGDGQARRKA
ncbi:hypothetical protein BJY59DRAFT_692525 [Rhodotorula toruloides]